MAMPSTDTDELAQFGCKQELDRPPGRFSSFAAGFSHIPRPWNGYGRPRQPGRWKARRRAP
jgi:hypothetical protein